MLEEGIDEFQTGRWTIRRAGCFRITDRAGHEVTPRGRKSRAIIAFLTVRADELVSRDRLIELLWGDRGDTQARDSLRQSLHEIRESCGDLIRSDRDHVWIDQSRVEFAQRTGDEEYFADLNHITPEFDEWLIGAREQEEQGRWLVLEAEIQALLVRGDYGPTKSLINQMEAIDPFNEDWIRYRMQAERQAGRPAAIEQSFARFAARLQQELGVLPSIETRKLRDQLIGELTSLPPSTVSQPSVDLRPPVSVPVAATVVSRRLILTSTLAGGTALLGGLFFMRSSARPKKLRSPPIVAVLPFTVEDESTELMDVARQISDDVRSDLSRMREIRVIATSSSRSAAAQGKSSNRIGELVGADLLVECQITRRASSIMATVSLVEVSTGVQTWSESESTPISESSELRAAISGAVIQQLTTIIPSSAAPAVPISRPDPVVYALLLRANQLLEEARSSSMRGYRDDSLKAGSQAASLVKQALAIKPDDSGALAILATIIRNGWTPELAAQPLTTEQRVEASIAIIRKALVADPENAAALTELGDYYRRFCFRWDDAENIFTRALSINPSLVEAHWSYGYELGTLGRGIEGLDHALSVFELDPRNPFRRIALPRLLYVAGRGHLAMRFYMSELRSDPNNLFLVRELYFIFLSGATSAELAALHALVRRLWGSDLNPNQKALLDRIDAGREARSGKPAKLRELVDNDVQQFDEPSSALNATPQGRARDDLPYIFAMEYAWSGAPEKSINMLDRALAGKSLYWPPTLPYGIAEFPWQVRTDRRYLALWQRDPGLSALMRRRRQAVASGQMAGFKSDGKKVTPLIPLVLQERVQRALTYT